MIVRPCINNSMIIVQCIRVNVSTLLILRNLLKYHVLALPRSLWLRAPWVYSSSSLCTAYDVQLAIAYGQYCIYTCTYCSRLCAATLCLSLPKPCNQPVCAHHGLILCPAMHAYMCRGLLSLQQYSACMPCSIIAYTPCVTYYTCNLKSCTLKSTYINQVVIII